MEGIQINGTNFGTDQSNVSIMLTNGGTTISGNVWGCSDTQINGEFLIPTDATLGAWDVVVKHIDDQQTGTISGGFTVNPGASISGRVTHNGSGLGNIVVAALPSDQSGDNESTSSASDGNYTISGLSPGVRYKIIFWDQSGALAFTYYHSRDTWDSADDVSAPNTGIDQDLEDGVTITGTVTDPDGNPVTDCWVAWSDSTAALSPTQVQTDSNGNYTLRGLKRGAPYKVSFNANIPYGSPLPYTPQWYLDQYNWAEADIVTAPMDHIDAQLSMTPAATVSGRVTDTLGAPLGNIYVIAFVASSGQQANASPGTAADGTYSISSLSPTTSYKILFYDMNSVYALEFYNGAGTWATATPVTGSSTGIDAAMQNAAPITGTVTDAVTHAPIQYCNVEWEDSTLNGLNPPSVQTNALGQYSLPGLKSGVPYKVSFNPPSPYSDEWYNAKFDWSSADLVAGGSSGVDANLYPNASPPEVTGIYPACHENTSGTVSATITGNNFKSGATVKLALLAQADIDATNVHVVSTHQITCDFDLAEKDAGEWDVVVTNPDTQEGRDSGGFEVRNPLPSIDSITPTSGLNTGTVDITDLAGHGFRKDAVVELQKGSETIVATDVNVTDTSITCKFDLAGATLGGWDVVVTNDGPGGGTATDAGAFTVYPQYNVNASVTGGHGTALPLTQKVDHGSNGTVNITPDAHYHIASITDNGISATIANPYVINNVVADHDVVVTFATGQCAVNASVSGGHGTVSPATQNVDYGSNASVNITPNTGYEIASITDNGATVPVANPYTISPVIADHTVVVTFKEIPVTTYSFYFAEGYTGPNFQEYLCLSNPNTTTASANVTYLFSDGTTKAASYTVPATGRYTVNVNSEVGANKEVSMKVLSDTANLVAERPMYFNYNGVWTGGSDAIGATAPNTSWYFAEGTTLPNFDEYVTVLNPGDTAASLTFRYMVEGAGEQDVPGSVGPHSRATFNTASQIGANKNSSLQLDSTQNVVAERPMYFNYHGAWTGGHDVVGANAPAKAWYLAEGTTRTGFEEWLCLQNPGSSPITVNATYQLGSGQGAPISKTYTVPAKQRLTVSVNAEIGPNKDDSVALTSTGSFIAERPMYFSYHGLWTGGHDVLGANASAKTWFFAEGTTRDNFDEWLTLQNPGSADAHVTITYYTTSGQAIPKSWTVSANSRLTVNVNQDAGANQDISARVSSDQPIIAERPMYFNYNGVWTGGHDVVGYVPQ